MRLVSVEMSFGCIQLLNGSPLNRLLSSSSSTSLSSTLSSDTGSLSSLYWLVSLFHKFASLCCASVAQFWSRVTLLYRGLFITFFKICRAFSIFWCLIFCKKTWPLNWIFLFSLIVIRESGDGTLVNADKFCSGLIGMLTTQPWTNFLLPCGSG